MATRKPNRSPRSKTATDTLGLRRITTLPALPRRAKDAHKGDFGRVLVIGGSRGMIGAPALVANAASRGGAGLVTVACPRSIQLAVATLCPCATTLPLDEDAAGRIDPARAIRQLRAEGLFNISTAPSVVAAGPGLGRGTATFDRHWEKLIDTFSRQTGIPVVLDADALNALARVSKKNNANRRDPVRHKTVLTPHPGEMARLCSRTTAEIQRRREGFAVQLARHLSTNNSKPDGDDRTVVALKGAGTIVTDGQRIYRNKTGNAGMATGGSGDVLTGLIAALIGQGMSRFQATVLGVAVHGRAGDCAAADLSQTSLVATDLLDYLPDVLPD